MELLNLPGFSVEKDITRGVAALTSRPQQRDRADAPVSKSRDDTRAHTKNSDSYKDKDKNDFKDVYEKKDDDLNARQETSKSETKNTDSSSSTAKQSFVEEGSEEQLELFVEEIAAELTVNDENTDFLVVTAASELVQDELTDELIDQELVALAIAPQIQEAGEAGDGEQLANASAQKIVTTENTQTALNVNIGTQDQDTQQSLLDLQNEEPVEDIPIELEAEAQEASPELTTKETKVATPAVSLGAAIAKDDSGMELAALVPSEGELDADGVTELNKTKMDMARQAASSPTGIDAARQVVAAMRAEKDSGNIELRLDPPELGKVRINMNVERTDSVTAVLFAEKSETLDLMRRNAEVLLKQLEEAGFVQVDLSFQSGSNNDTDNSFAQQADNPFGHWGHDQNGNVPPGEIVYLQMRSDARLDRKV